MSIERPWRRTPFAVGALALSSTVVLAGCSSPTSDEPSATQLVVLAENVPDGLDVDGPSWGSAPSQTGIVNLGENLIGFAPGGTNDDNVDLFDFTKFEGRLAESWTFDEANLTWTFNLRQDVVGCEGATFDADDVVYSFARTKSASGANNLSHFMARTAKIDTFTEEQLEGVGTELGDEVTKVDQYTVAIRVSENSPLFLPVMATWAGSIIFDKETMEANATPDDPWAHDYVNNTNLPSFSPYCLDEWDKGSRFVVSANPDYYRGKAAYERIVFQRIPESSNRASILAAGDADLVERLTPQEITSVGQEDGVSTASVVGNETLSLHLNWNTPPFDNEHVRRALAYAIPYDEIIDQAYMGLAQQWRSALPSTYPGYVETSTQYAYDLDAARQELELAGYPDGAGLEAFGDALRLSYISERGTTLDPAATLIQSALNEIGVSITLDPQPNATFIDRLKNKKDLPMALNDTEKATPVDGGYALLISQTSPGVGCCANHTGYTNPDVDQLVLDANATADEAVRNPLLAEAQEIVMAAPNWVPIAETRTTWAFSSDVTGLTWYPNNSLRWYHLRPAESGDRG